MKVIPIRNIITTFNEPKFSESFVIRDVKELLGGNDMIQELHRHDFFFILALKKGMGMHEIDFIPFDICDYSIFIMRPGQVHKLLLKTGSTGFLIQFSLDFYQPIDSVAIRLFRQASNKNLCRLNATALKKIFFILQYIFIEHTDKKEGYHKVIKASLGIFFIELLRHRQNLTSPINGHNLYTQEQLEKFLDLLELHILSEKQVSQYASRMNLTPYQLNAITKATLNKSCSDVINEHIILESKRYLLATSNQVNLIANFLGFEDVSYFIRYFKKHSGFSPEVFRNKFK